MNSWKGADGEYVVDGMPHKTKLPRKPKGVGTEIKSLACDDTGIILKLEIRSQQKKRTISNSMGREQQ